MSLRRAVAAASATPRHRLCTVTLIRMDLDPDDAADLDEMLADRSITGKALSAGLQSLGHHVTPVTINRHRRGECSCGSA